MALVQGSFSGGLADVVHASQAIQCLKDNGFDIDVVLKVKSVEIIDKYRKEQKAKKFKSCWKPADPKHPTLYASGENVLCFGSGNVQIGGTLRIHHGSASSVQIGGTPAPSKPEPPVTPIQLSVNPRTKKPWPMPTPEGYHRSKKRQYRDDVIRPGVYLLFWGEEIVYVGQSIHPYGRIHQHDKEKLKSFDSFRILHCREKHLNYWERKLIRRFDPKYNRTHTKRKRRLA